jgi:CRP-like cAMP-binding protein
MNKAQEDKKRNKERLLKALEASLGVVTDACKKVKLSRQTFYKYLKEDPDFKAAVLELEEVALDTAESALFNQIKEGNVTSIIFYLKTKGRRRGYVERQEISGPDGGPVQTEALNSLNLEKLSLDELKQLEKIFNPSLKN